MGSKTRGAGVPSADPTKTRSACIPRAVPTKTRSACIPRANPPKARDTCIPSANPPGAGRAPHTRQLRPKAGADARGPHVGMRAKAGRRPASSCRCGAESSRKARI